MQRWFGKPQPIYGFALRRRRFTLWAALYFVLFFCLPLLGFCAVLDLLFYVIYSQLFGTCYGVLCWLG